MIPHPNAGWYPAPPARPAAIYEAQRALSDAVDYAGPHEFAQLIDRALARGARIDRDVDFNPPNYENHFLVCAARANKPWAIPILMARGARLPPVPDDGKDLVMDACLAGHTEMVRTLIEVARFDISVPDRRQRTALHYASFAGASDCVAVLLKHGADPNAVFTAMGDADLASAFGAEHELEGFGITPLMIAAGYGDEAIVRQLLEDGASPDAGGCSPLIIAAGRNHPAILRTLFASGASLDRAQDQDGRCGLYALLHARPSIDCLRVAVRHHDFSADSGGIQSPLGVAIDQRAPAVVALFLGCGAAIEPQSTSHETLWDRAFLREHDRCPVLELMAATSPCEEFTEAPERFCELLGWIVDRCVDAPALASDGLFPSLLLPATQALLQIRERMNALSEKQVALHAAFALTRHLRPLPPIDASAVDPDCLDLVWMQHTEACRHSQWRFLLEHSQALTDECMDKLRHAVTLEFFTACLSECPPNISRRDFVENRLSEEFGLPETVVRLLTMAWMQAAHCVNDWEIAPGDESGADRFVDRYAHNWMREALDDLQTNGNPALVACLAVMRETLAKEPAALSTFCSNPVAWLRNFENRNHLRPVNQSGLAKALAIELGLPPSTCTGIASAWRQAIDSARTSREWQTPAQLTSFLERLMQAPIDEVMGDDDNDELIPLSDRQRLSDWVNTARALPAPSLRKRSADGDEVSESSPKQARH